MIHTVNAWLSRPVWIRGLAPFARAVAGGCLAIATCSVLERCGTITHAVADIGIILLCTHWMAFSWGRARTVRAFERQRLELAAAALELDRSAAAMEHAHQLILVRLDQGPPAGAFELARRKKRDHPSN